MAARTLIAVTQVNERLELPFTGTVPKGAVVPPIFLAEQRDEDWFVMANLPLLSKGRRPHPIGLSHLLFAIEQRRDKKHIAIDTIRYWPFKNRLTGSVKSEKSALPPAPTILKSANLALRTLAQNYPETRLRWIIDTPKLQ